MPEPYSE